MNEVALGSSRRNVPDAPVFHAEELRLVEKSIRRIVRAHDVQSKALVKQAGLTAAQLVILKGIAELGEVTTTALSTYGDVSPATVVTILDNLEERGLIERYRSRHDRRIVHTRLTGSGSERLAAAPEPLGRTFADRLAAMGATRRAALVRAIAEVADLLAPEAPPNRKEGA